MSVRFLLLPAALLAVLLVRAHPLPLAIPLLLDYVLAARVLLALALIIQPVLLLSSEHRSMSPLWGFVVGFVATLAGGIAYALVVMIAGMSVTAAAIIAGVAGLALGSALSSNSRNRSYGYYDYGYSRGYSGYRYDPRYDSYYGGYGYDPDYRGYGYRDYGYGYGYRTCVRRERGYDQYTGRRITIERRYAC